MIRKDLPMGVIIDILLASTQAIMNPQRLGELNLSPADGYAAIMAVIFEGVMSPSGRPKR
jgi:hypothetical protein